MSRLSSERSVRWLACLSIGALIVLLAPTGTLAADMAVFFKTHEALPFN